MCLRRTLFCRDCLDADVLMIPSPFDTPEELDGLDQNNILDGDSKTRGVDNDAYKQEREVDAAVDAAT